MPRILRSPGSKSFKLENVSVPNADGPRCERRRHPRRPKASLGPQADVVAQLWDVCCTFDCVAKLPLRRLANRDSVDGEGISGSGA
jgi:hypothetical protein